VTQQPPAAQPEFIGRLRAGDPEALGVVYDRYAPMVFRIGYRLLGDALDAEDLVHDVFVGLARAVKTFEGRGSFENWLRRVATRAALMKLRQRQVLQRGQRRYGRLFARFQRQPDVLEGLELEDALLQLDVPLRAVFVLKEMEGYSHEEIAEILGITPGAARIRLYRARRKLRTYMRRD
jgi:RNA polymerase sigma-70 factor (ECF subfamily)